jgi:hypothetical protein
LFIHGELLPRLFWNKNEQNIYVPAAFFETGRQVAICGTAGYTRKQIKNEANVILPLSKEKA